MKIVRKNDIKSDKYYSYKHLGNAFGESLYEEEFNSVLYESDQQKAKDRQQIIDRVPEKTIKKDILYEKIFNLEPLKEITYTVESNYHDKSLTVLGSDNSSIIINWKYDIINWYVNENTLVFREVDRSTNEQYDRTINISNGIVEGSRRVMLEERFQEFVNKSIDEPERGPIGLGSYPGIQGGPYEIDTEDPPGNFRSGIDPCTILEQRISLMDFRNWSSGTKPTTPVYSEPGTGSSPGEGFDRLKACLRGIAILVNNSGEITCSAVTGSTTNNLDLETLLTNSGLVPSEEGSYTFVFEFFGWRRNGTHANGEGWQSADDKYDIYVDFLEGSVYTTTHNN